VQDFGFLLGGSGRTDNLAKERFKAQTPSLRLDGWLDSKMGVV